MGGVLHRLRDPLNQAYLRLFLVQASWNYRTMIGGGFLHALTPLVRGGEERGGARGRADSILERHRGHFNSHPFLAGLAVGAVARMELAGEPPEQVARFKEALRGPLGSLGDALFWTGWLPLVMFGVAALLLAGLSPLWVIPAALLLYNLPHLAARRLALQWGWRLGKDAPARLREAGIPRMIERVRDLAMAGLGVLMGLLVTLGPGVSVAPGRPWLVVALILLPILIRGGAAAGRVAFRLAPILLLLLFVLGGRT